MHLKGEGKCGEKGGKRKEGEDKEEEEGVQKGREERRGERGEIWAKMDRKGYVDVIPGGKAILERPVI